MCNPGEKDGAATNRLQVEYALLLELSQAISTTLDLAVLVQVISDGTARLLGVETTALAPRTFQNIYQEHPFEQHCPGQPVQSGYAAPVDLARLGKSCPPPMFHWSRARHDFFTVLGRGAEMSFSISSCGVNTAWVVPSRQACLNCNARRPSGSSLKRSLAMGGRARYLTKISKRWRSLARAQVFAWTLNLAISAQRLPVMVGVASSPAPRRSMRWPRRGPVATN
jgi:hypothetical protein